jgi:dipeptidyl aminopeptidase/acylaminoacyl peptidase
MPRAFTAKADDGLTDLYGVMYKPFDFDPNKKYRSCVCLSGPQTESVTQVFTPRSANIGLAQLGFIVVEVGNRGAIRTARSGITPSACNLATMA